jgi:hypothetical protein
MSLGNQNTKERSQRIRLDYLRRTSALDRWKIGLVLLALTAAVAYAVWSAVGNDTVRHFSPGPLAKVHAMWDQQCEVCHSSFVPTNSTAWTGDPHASDKLCWECHQVTKHATNQIDGEVVSCAACHSDHHGRNADLVAVADSECIKCHKDIQQHHDPNTRLTIADLKAVNIDFATDHPEFVLRSPRKDPGPLKFSHAWHLLPGLGYGTESPSGKGPYRFSDLNPEDRVRYKKEGQSDNELIKLECNACHQLARNASQIHGAVNGSDVGQEAVSSPVRGAGDYMLPVSYELHCRACHPLSYSGRTEPAVVAPSDNQAGRFAAQPGETVPHGWTDAQLRKYLERVLAMQLVNHPDSDVRGKPLPSAVKNQPPPNSPLPNKTSQPHPQAHTIGDYLDQELNDRVSVLRNECSVCHVAKSSEGLDVEPVSISRRWLEQAKFNHTAHSRWKCTECHAVETLEQLPADPKIIAAYDSAEKLIPKKEVCLECHSPPRGSGAEATGGARFDCIECHRYHSQ